MQVAFNTNIFIPRMPVRKALNTQNLAPLTSDVVTFSGRKNFLSHSEDEIFSQIEASVKDKNNILGQGGEAVVYKIPDTNYCVRLDKGTKNAYKNRLSFKLNEQDRINHVVAKLGGESSIMKYIEGTPVVSINMTKGEILKTADDIAQMPVSAFRKMLHQICYAKERGMVFDCAWGNVIVNPKKQSLTAIDFYKSEEVMSPLSYMYSSLVYPDTPIDRRKPIAGKIIKSALEELKPAQKPCIKPDNFAFSSLMYELGAENLKVRVIENQKYMKLLNKLFTEIQELKFQEFRGIDVRRDLNGKLKVVNCLVKQLFGVL